jgi:23S rRNA pseudouridine2605 synthase
VGCDQSYIGSTTQLTVRDQARYDRRTPVYPCGGRHLPALGDAKKMPGKPRRPRRDPSPEGTTAERLQKVLAAAGVGSRRECEQLIEEGRIEVDRVVVTELGTRVDPSQREIRVDGTPLQQTTRRVYYAVNKPMGVLCTNRDPSGRTRVIDLLPSNDRLFTIGRLDQSSEGLILVTNDGELANLLTHPRYGVDKVYRVRVSGNPSPELLRKLERGIHLAEGFARVASVRLKKRLRAASELEMVLNEGRNREIRRLLARIGHKVLQLKRTAIGPVRLGDMPAGAYRPLTNQEVKQLRNASRPKGAHSKESQSKGTPSRQSKGAQTASKPNAAQSKRGKATRPTRPVTSGASAVKKRAKSAGANLSGTVLAYEEEPPSDKRAPSSSRRPGKRAARRPK